MPSDRLGYDASIPRILTLLKFLEFVRSLRNCVNDPRLNSKYIQVDPLL